MTCKGKLDLTSMKLAKLSSKTLLMKEKSLNLKWDRNLYKIKKIKNWKRKLKKRRNKCSLK